MRKRIFWNRAHPLGRTGSRALLPFSSAGAFLPLRSHTAPDIVVNERSPVMLISPHLIYAGDCRQAIDLYVSAFNADVRGLITYAEQHLAAPPGMEGRIARAVLVVDGGRLELSDTLSHDVVTHSAQSALLVEGSTPQIQQAQRVLLEEGHRLPATHFVTGAFSCTVLDRFGVTWQLLEQDTA
ncbi:VOC family protein [Microbacterium oxydans]|uniref:VOC family protein n=1 Tax=Microbacterium oxydans TaxID=82380 RepID=UPI0024ADB570|nr:VOC family protein [Microbacterium oxydans]